MRDCIVQTIATLSTLLVDKTQECERAQDAINSVREEMVTAIDNLRWELNNARDTHAAIERDLKLRIDQERRDSSTDWKHRDRSLLFGIVMDSPDTFMLAITYLRSERGCEMRKNGLKIQAIKEVRNLTGYGLKEAKDLVVAFFDHPTDAPAP